MTNGWWRIACGVILETIRSLPDWLTDRQAVAVCYPSHFCVLLHSSAVLGAGFCVPWPLLHCNYPSQSVDRDRRKEREGNAKWLTSLLAEAVLGMRREGQSTATVTATAIRLQPLSLLQNCLSIAQSCLYCSRSRYPYSFFIHARKSVYIFPFIVPLQMFMQMSRVSQLAYSNPPIPALFQCFLLNSFLFVNAVWSNLTFPRKCTKCAMPFPHFTIDFHFCFRFIQSFEIHFHPFKLLEIMQVIIRPKMNCYSVNCYK